MAEDKKYDHSGVTIIWEGDPPPADIEATLRDDIKTQLADLEDPEQLMMAHITCGTDEETSPSIKLWGDFDEPGVLFGSYHPPGDPAGKPVTFKLDDLPELKDQIEKAMEAKGEIPPWKLH